MIRVLIVDDKLENLYLLRALLQGHGYAVDEARNGAEALTRARQEPPNLVISDLLMPVMDGYTLLRQWKADEHLQTIPFVVYTATYTEPKDERLALGLGADAFIIKPVEPEPFMARIQEVLVKKARGELSPARAPEGHEAGLLKEYSEVLIHKLEEKVFQLEQANHALQEEIARRQKIEAELIEAREEWENIFQATGHPIIIMDLEHRIVAANKKCSEVTGKSHDELLNAKCYEVLHANGRRPQDCPMGALLQSGSSQSVEMEALNGHYLISLTPVLDQEGDIRKVIHVATDVTERKRSEDALRESEEQFRLLFENSLDAIVLAIPDGRVLRANPAACQMFGLTEEEIRRIGREGVVDATDPRLNLALEDRKRTGRFQGELNFKRKDGSVFPAELSSVLFKDAEGQWKSTMIIRDVTGRRRSEEAQKRLATAVEQAAEGILITDNQGIIEYVNPAFENITGYSREDAIGENPRFLKSGEHDNVFYEGMWRTITSGNVWSGKLTNRKKDGGLYQEETSISPVKDKSGQIVNFVALKRDITEHLELSRQLLQAQKMEAVGTLAGGVAHDFNNVLQVVLGYSDLILGEEKFRPSHRADLQKINQAARRGAELVQRLLTFSRKTELKPQPLSLNRRINEMRKMIERTIPKMIDIQLILVEDLCAINADSTQIDQILMNLAVNARDAMPDGGRLIFETANVVLDEEYARLHVECEPGNHVLLMVTDTGSGMDRDTLEHIFEPFFTTKEVGEGTGLGLAMVHGIVKLHGGHIRCYSEPGQGTTFKIYFPALISDEEKEEIKVREMPRGGSETILLVDDEELIRDLGFRILTKVGYKVITASNGKEALERYKASSDEIALVILDLIMPEIGGKQCLEGLLSLDPSAKVVMASGYSADGPTKDALAAGAKGFVHKPYDIRQMLGVVRQVLDAE